MPSETQSPWGLWPGFIICAALSEHSYWFNSMNFCQIVLTEYSFFIRETEITRSDPPPNCHVLQEIKWVKTKGWLIPFERQALPCCHSISFPVWQGRCGEKLECIQKREASRRRWQARQGMKGACFVLCAWESTCSLIKGKITLQLVKTPLRKLK